MAQEISYRDAFGTLAKGHKQLGVCLAKTAKHTLKDVARGILHHPLVFIVLVIAYVCMFVTMVNARAERDNLTQQMYHYEQSNDSLELLTKKLY